jgi:sulfate transport system permease protein
VPALHRPRLPCSRWLAIPVGTVAYETFEPGLGAVWDSITTPAAISAFWLTITVTAIAVPLNTVLGIVTALVLVRSRMRGRAILDALIDLPFAVSPVVVGLALLLLYGREGWFGDELAAAGIRVVFSFPGIVLATIFVSLPFVVREVGTGAAGDRDRPGAGGPDARRQPLADLLADHAPRDPLGPRLRRRALDGPRARRVRRGPHRLWQGVGRDETMTLLVEKRFQNFDLAGRLRGVDAARAAWPWPRCSP